MNWYKKAKIMLKAEDISISKDEFNKIEELVKNIIRGKKDWSPEEIQLRMNYPLLIESMLRNIYNPTFRLY